MVRLVSRSRYPNNKKFGRGSGRGRGRGRYDLGFRILSLNQFVRRFIVTMIIIIVIILVHRIYFPFNSLARRRIRIKRYFSILSSSCKKKERGRAREKRVECEENIAKEGEEKGG